MRFMNFEIPESDMRLLDKLNQDKAIAWAANGLNPMEIAAPLR
jgi:2,5-diketo-D-gluconate reductase A